MRELARKAVLVARPATTIDPAAATLGTNDRWADISDEKSAAAPTVTMAP